MSLLRAQLVAAVLAELQKPGHGVLGPPLARLPEVVTERQARVQRMPWSTEPAASLIDVMDLYVSMLTEIDQLVAPVLRAYLVAEAPEAAVLRARVAEPAVFGALARRLFLYAALWTHRSQPDPVAPLLPVLDLAQAGPLAEEELLHRLQTARDGAAVTLNTTTRFLAASEDAYGERLVPGLDLGRITLERDRALRTLGAAVHADLRRRPGVYHALRARIAREEQPRPPRVEHVLAAHTLDVALHEWRTLNVNALVTRGLHGHLLAPRRLADRAVDYLLRTLARRERYFPDLDSLANDGGPLARPKPGVRRPPAVAFLDQQQGDSPPSLEVRDEPDPDHEDAVRAVREVLRTRPDLRVGFDVACSEAEGESLAKLSKQFGRTRQTLAKYRNDFLAAVRARLSR